MAESHIGFAALLLSGLILAACQTGPGVNVPEGAASGDLELRATGSGNWGVACSGISTRGREAQADIKGRGNATDVIVLNDLTSATCDFSAGDAPFTLTLTESGLACPFGAFEDGICTISIAANTSGSFEFLPE